MLEKIKTYAIIGLAVLFLAASVLAYAYIHKYNETNALSEARAALIVQNDSSYANLLKQKDDTIQTQAVHVKNLNNDVSKKDAEKGYWKALYTVTKVKLDSIQQHGTGIASSGKDSTGEYGQVDFFGNKGIVSYKGLTKYYIIPQDAKPLWDITIAFKQFPIYSSLYQDVDKIWRIKSYVDEEGIKFTTYSEVDSTIFISYKSQTVRKEVKTTPFGLRLKANVALVGTEANIKLPFSAKNILLDASAEVYYDFLNITYYPASNMFSAGVVYNVDISKIFKIF